MIYTTVECADKLTICAQQTVFERALLRGTYDTPPAVKASLTKEIAFRRRVQRRSSAVVGCHVNDLRLHVFSPCECAVEMRLKCDCLLRYQVRSATPKEDRGHCKLGASLRLSMRTK